MKHCIFAATTSLLYSKHMDVALADAYKRGRLAPPTDTEIEAVAKKTAVAKLQEVGWHRKRLCGEGRR